MPFTKPKIVESENIEFVGYHDAAGSGPFKLAIHKKGSNWFLYTGCLWKRGWNIFDVTNPSDPKLVSFVEFKDHKQFKNAETTWTIQIDVAEGKMITALQKVAPFEWGVEENAPFEEGALIWDVSEDPVRPMLLGHYSNGGLGNHRNFYGGGKYVYMCTTPRQFVMREGKFHSNNILAIVDISDPHNPKEVSRWWWPGQNVAAGEKTPLAHYFHGPAYVAGNRAYLSYGTVGMVILDISDVTDPRLVSTLSFGELGPKRVGWHTVLPIPERKLALAACEPMDTIKEQSFAFVIDVSDEKIPKVIGTLPTPVPSPGLPYHNYWEKGEPSGRFGPHNFHHNNNNPDLFRPVNTMFLAYTIAGLRVFDIKDKYRPEEVGYFVPEDPKVRCGPRPLGRLVLDFDDVLVDARGYAYCTEKNTGLYVLKYKGEMS